MRAYFEKLLKTPINNKNSYLYFPLLIALISGAIFSLALAPYYYWWLAILSPALFYAVLRNVTHAKLLAWLGLWFWPMVRRRVLALHLHPCLWRYQCLFKHFDDCLYGSSNGLIYSFSNMAVPSLFPRNTLTFAPLWVLFEWAKTWVFTGFPWLFAGYAFTERLLDGYAPLFGIYAVSFVVIVLACALVEILNRRWFWAIPSALLIAGAWGAGFIQFVQPKAAKPLSVSLIQGNIPQDLKWLTEYQIKTLEIYATLTRAEWGRDLIVWPESSIPYFKRIFQTF
jgi:apolipoprotein N-acyltransferase